MTPPTKLYEAVWDDQDDYINDAGLLALPCRSHRVADERRRVDGHRLVYERLVGPIPAAKPVIHHICENPRCVEVDHLVAVSVAQHRLIHGELRFSDAPCKHCGETDWATVAATGERRCRECARRKARAKRATRKVSA